MCCAASSSSASTASSPRADAVDRLGRPSGALHPGSRFAAQGVLRGIDHAGAGAAAAAQGAGGDRLLQLLGPVRDRPAGHRVASRGARPAARLGGAASAVRRPGGRSGRGGGAADLPPGGGPHRERAPAPAVAGDSPEERALLLARARTQIAFYGSTRNYAFHFDDLGTLERPDAGERRGRHGGAWHRRDARALRRECRWQLRPWPMLFWPATGRWHRAW